MRRPYYFLSVLSFALLFTGCGRSGGSGGDSAGGSDSGSPDAPLWSPVAEISSPSDESWYSANGDGNRVLFGRHVAESAAGHGSDAGGDEAANAVSGDGRHAVWEMVRDSTGAWSEPSIAPFSGEHNDRAARFYSVLDAVLYSSDRPLPGVAGGTFNLWVVAHDGEGWMPAEPFDALNSTANDYHASVSSTGAIFFASEREGGLGGADIYRAELSATGYVVTPLPGDVNSRYSERDLFVDPDERFMIVTRSGDPRGLGGDDLFVSFKEGDSWSKPEWLGPSVNTPENEYGAWISPDGTLYVTSHVAGQADIHALPARDVPLLAP